MDLFSWCAKLVPEPDRSLDNFFTVLYNKIQENRLQKSVICFKFSNMYEIDKLELYKKILEYRNNNGTTQEPFYSQFNIDHPEIKILRIGQISTGIHSCRCHDPHSHNSKLSYLDFAVYYEKYNVVEPKMTISNENKLA